MERIWRQMEGLGVRKAKDSVGFSGLSLSTRKDIDALNQIKG